MDGKLRKPFPDSLKHAQILYNHRIQSPFAAWEEILI